MKQNTSDYLRFAKFKNKKILFILQQISIWFTLKFFDIQRELNVVKYPGQIPSRKAFKFLVVEDPINRHYRGLNKGPPVDGAPSERKATL